MDSNIELISPYAFPGVSKKGLNKKKYPYLFTTSELKYTKDEILNTIAEESEFTTDEILSKSRETDYVILRNLYCKILKVNGMTLTEIGRHIGKDHTTIIHAIKKFESDYQYNEIYRKLSDRVFSKVGVKIKND